MQYECDLSHYSPLHTTPSVLFAPLLSVRSLTGPRISAVKIQTDWPRCSVRYVPPCCSLSNTPAHLQLPGGPQARSAHPILGRYTNNWASAAIARQYMSNKRKHAYKQGYIKKRGAWADKENTQGAGSSGRRDDDDGAAGAGTVA